MPGANRERMSEIKVDMGSLYQEEIFTDLRVATIQRLSPVKPDGSPDPSRPVVFVGQTHVMSAAGPVPIECRIEAKTLEEALQKFPAAIQQAVEEMIQEVREMQRQEASRIVIPQAGQGKIKLG